MKNKPPVPQKTPQKKVWPFLLLLAGNTVLSLCSYQVLLRLAGAEALQQGRTLFSRMLVRETKKGKEGAFCIYEKK